MLNPTHGSRSEGSREAAFERISSCNLFNITAEHGHQPFNKSSHCDRDWHIQVADPDYQTNPLTKEHQVYRKQVVQELAYGSHLWQQNVKPTASELTKSEMGTAIGRFACSRVFGFDDPGKGTPTGGSIYDKLLNIGKSGNAGLSEYYGLRELTKSFSTAQQVFWHWVSLSDRCHHTHDHVIMTDISGITG